jgi:5-methylthioadenosine/S-adenosylhomocysteine deaminase
MSGMQSNGRAESGGRTLVVGDPVFVLGAEVAIPDGALVIEGAEVTHAGPREAMLAHGPFTRVLGSGDHIVLPGFVNCHYHSELAMGPGLYQHIFEKANVHIHAGTSPIDETDLYDGVLWGLVAAIRGGQTGTVDMFYGRPGMPQFGAGAALQAYADAGIRTAFGVVSRDQNRYAHEPDEQFLRRLDPSLAEEVRGSPMGYAWPVDEVMTSFDRLFDTWHGYDDRLRLVTAPDWTPACSDELYRRCRRVADEHGTSMVTHVLETRAEMLYNVAAYGKPAVRRLADLGVLTPETVLAHFIWVTDEELSVFADSGAVCSNNPGSNLRLSSGICRTRDLLGTGGRVGFGTDGISFSDHEDFFQELRLAAYLQRTPSTFGEGRLDSTTVLTSAAESGAQALGLAGRLGALTAGHLADLLIVDKSRLFFPPGRFDAEPALDVVLDRAEARDIDTVMVGGRVLMEGGRVTVVDEDALRDRFAEAVTARVYRQTATTERWAELGRLVEPAVVEMFTEWYKVPVEAAYSYNAARLSAPPGTNGFDRTRSSEAAAT